MEPTPSLAKRGRPLGWCPQVVIPQSRDSSPPLAEHSIDAWLSAAVSRKLRGAGISTVGELVRFVSDGGRSWNRSIKGLGPAGARQLMQWFDEHGETLGRIDRDLPQWLSALPLSSTITPLKMGPDFIQLEYRDGGQVATPRPGQCLRRLGMAPFELIFVPEHLDGSSGVNRGRASNLLGVSTDYAAIRAWLSSYLTAGKKRTFEAYRREIERFYAWCLNVARVALSSITLKEALAYQAFLQCIPDEFIGQARVTREDDRWRPWRGQLDHRSQNYALSVVSQCFKALWANGYLVGNPFTSLVKGGGKVRAMDTTRSLSDLDLQWVRDRLEQLPGLRSRDPFRLAVAKRMVLIFHLCLKTGMRLEELATTSVNGLRPARVDGVEQTGEWIMTVNGKGSKLRDIPVPGELLAMIQAHHEDAISLLRQSGVEAKNRIEALRASPPLLCALAAPVGHKRRAIDDDAEMASDNVALSRSGLYRTLKAFFRTSAKEGLGKARKALEQAESKLSRDPDPGTRERTLKKIEQHRHEVETWQRRGRMSTHWLRHTFAIEVLRANPNDLGMKLAQQLLGHQSIETTAGYLKQDDSAKVRALRRVNPLVRNNRRSDIS